MIMIKERGLILLKIKKRELLLTLIIITIMPILIPSSYTVDGIGSYKFGFPIPYITIYQNQPGSAWLGANFFSGNAGLSVNLFILFANIAVIYIIIHFIGKFMKQRELNKERDKSLD